jgi:hypothetical protein
MAAISAARNVLCITVFGSSCQMKAADDKHGSVASAVAGAQFPKLNNPQSDEVDRLGKP